MTIILRSIVKNYINFFGYTFILVTYPILSTSIFSCIITLIPNLTIIFIFSMFIVKVLFKYITNFKAYDFCCYFDNNVIFFFLKLIIFIVCSFKDSQNLFMQSLPLYTSCFFSMLLNYDSVGIEELDGICSPAFVVDEVLGLFLHPSVFTSIVFTSSSFLLNIQYLHK